MLLERHEAAQSQLETLWTTRTDGRWQVVVSLLEAVDTDAGGEVVRALAGQLARLVDNRRYDGTVVYLDGHRRAARR